MSGLSNSTLKNTSLILLLLTFCSVGCSRQPPTELLNNLKLAREHVGLRPVQAKWRIEHFYESEIAWSDPDEKSDKKVAYDKDGALWEEDYFYSGREFPIPDKGTGFEQLTVHYDYKTGLCAVRVITDNPKLEAVVKGDVENSGVKLENALVIAREILKKVGDDVLMETEGQAARSRERRIIGEANKRLDLLN